MGLSRASWVSAPGTGNAPEGRRGQNRGMPDLSERDRALLHFEEQWTTPVEGKEAQVFKRFGLSMIEYERVVDALLQRPDVAADYRILFKRRGRARG